MLIHTLLSILSIIGRCHPKFYQQVRQRKGLAYSRRPTRRPLRSSPTTSAVTTVAPTFEQLGRSTSHHTCRRLLDQPSGITYRIHPAAT